MNRMRGNRLGKLAHTAWFSAVRYTKITYRFTSRAFFYISLLRANPTAIAKIRAENERGILLYSIKKIGSPAHLVVFHMSLTLIGL